MQAWSLVVCRRREPLDLTAKLLLFDLRRILLLALIDESTCKLGASLSVVEENHFADQVSFASIPFDMKLLLTSHDLDSKGVLAVRATDTMDLLAQVFTSPLMDPDVKVTLLLEVFKRHTGVHVLNLNILSDTSLRDHMGHHQVPDLSRRPRELDICVMRLCGIWASLTVPDQHSRSRK